MAALFLVALLAFGGCSNNSPMQPNLPQSTGLNKLIPTGDPLQFSQPVMDAAYIDSDDGGVIEIAREGYIHEFVVDAGALGEDTETTVESWRDEIGAGDVIVFDFGPDGLLFSKAAHLRFEIAELNERAATANLYHLDPDKGDWILQESSQVDNGVPEFPIYHFSKYALSD